MTSASAQTLAAPSDGSIHTHALAELLALSAEQREVLAALVRTLPATKRAQLAHPLALAAAVLEQLGDGGAWQSPRMASVREALVTLVHSSPEAMGALHGDAARPQPRWLQVDQAIVLSFGGQAADYAPELRATLRASERARRVTAKMASAVRQQQGHDLMALLDAQAVDWHDTERSFPFIFIAQVARLHALLDRYETLPARVVATAGHSQGVFAALYCSELLALGDLNGERAARYAALLACIGRRTQEAHPVLALPASVVETARAETGSAPTPMAALSGVTREWVSELLREFAAARPQDVVAHALENSTFRHVVAGSASTLERLRRFMLARAAAKKKAKTAGAMFGFVGAPEWSYLPVSSPFHSPLMASAVAPILADARAMDFDIAPSALAVPVVAPDGPGRIDEDVLARAVVSVCTGRTAWPEQLATVMALGATCAVDVGPSDALAKLTASSLRGTGLAVVSANDDKALEASRLALRADKPYAAWAPGIARAAGRDTIDNGFSRTFGYPPVFLAGMTPTTAEAPIVAAAANAGFIAELAGGGQVTEAIMRARFDELRELLSPGAGFVLNTLYLDAYLWKLQMGPGRLAIKLRDAGYPLLGVTVSAGIPPLQEAVALLGELNAHGLWLNSFKPGNSEQIAEVLAIADACPALRIGVQIEGGKAGGHHSFEALDELLLRHYAELRKRPNIVLSVGGGVGTEARAAAYLMGDWHGGKALAAMPVDGVFIGTAAMAALEAKTSQAVKRALVAALGADRGVCDGEVVGGVTSGRSQLDAPIYFLENSATRAARLLDSFGADEAAIAANKDAIVEALAATAKPYFGDVEAMTYAALLGRLLDLTATGRHGRYEDGAWPDVSYRKRFALMLDRAEARLCADKSQRFAPLSAEPGMLDDPRRCLEIFLARHPAAATTLLHAGCVRAFLDVCSAPGKPVCFVPVIDTRTRRFYKADSLWQSHDDRFSADQVFAIPGPAAVAAITQIDEPVASILERFNGALAARTLPVRLLGCRADLKTSELGQGPLAAALSAADAITTRGTWKRNPLRDLFLSAREGRTARIERSALGVLERVSLVDGGETIAEAALVGAVVDARIVVGAQALPLCLRWDDSSGAHGALVWDEEAFAAAQSAFFAALMQATAVPRTVSAAQLGAFTEAVGGAASAPTSLAFSLAWNDVFAALALLSPDMTALVHEDNSVRVAGEWPPAVGAEVTTTVTVSAIEATAKGTRIETMAVLRTAAAPLAEMRSRFFVRDWKAGAAAQLSAVPTETSEEGFVAVAPRLVAAEDVRAPRELSAYAAASGDANPLHTSAAFAQLAGFAGPIVHGMWTAGCLETTLCRALSQTQAVSARAAQVRFLGVVWPGERLRIEAEHVGWVDGAAVLDAKVLAPRGEDEPALVATARVWLAAEQTAYIFPGQGVQAAQMGMAAYGRSKAARLVWDEAERTCRDVLGFSLLRVVRDNPRELLVRGTLLRHPAGVLFLTQFTQAAMAVMAVAQVAEQRERGLFVPGAMFAGHSVGEYSALAAVAESVPVSALVQVVYQRGATMDQLIARDALGRSPFAMGVIRPHDAKLSEQETFALVGEVSAALGLPLEIVNFNIRGKQYSVTGDVRALRALESALLKRQAALGAAPGKAPKPAFVLVPGIDVPFHSTLLRAGVAEFRRVLDALLPADVHPERLIGRYIPNLVAAPFALTREFVALVHAESGSPVLEALLRGWVAGRDEASSGLARTLLIELLAYQFASPVRWIETQELLLAEARGLHRVIEIGLAEQPTLANMAKATLALDPLRLSAPRVLNSEASFAALATLDVKDPVSAPEHADAPAVAAAPLHQAQSKAPSSPQAPARPVVAALPVQAKARPERVHALALRALLALQAKVRVEQVRDDETLDELLSGNSARRNQLLADLGAEFSVPAVDGAHELPIGVLATKLEALAPRYRLPGRYLAAAVDAQIQKAFASAGLRAKELAARCAHLGEEHAQLALQRLALVTRAGDSNRGGALADASFVAVSGDKTKLNVWLDAFIAAYAAEHALAAAAPEAAAAPSADPEALKRLHDKLLGHDGVLTRTADALNEALSEARSQRQPENRPENGPEKGPETAQRTSADADLLALYRAEHGTAYERAISPLFDAERHLALTSQWAWVARDVAAYAHALMRGGAVDAAREASLMRRLTEEARTMAAALAADASKRGHVVAAERMQQLAASPLAAPRYLPSFTPLQPVLEDGAYVERPRPDAANPAALMQRLVTMGACVVRHGAPAEPLASTSELVRVAEQGESFADVTALVTGASPGSIAFAVVRGLLQGGARVIVTTQTYNDARLDLYKAMFAEVAAPGAELHIVPANLASFADVEALTQWIVSSRVRQTPLGTVSVKEAWLPNLILPFAATTDVATVASMGDASLATVRLLLLGVERLLGSLTAAFAAHGDDRLSCHVVLPLSPNHGVFGGDGAYAESKAALETLLAKHASERASWGRFFSIVGARIGWVRGTGLMDQNDRLAAELERTTPLQTFTTDEMASCLLALMTPPVRQEARAHALLADLSGQLGQVPDLAARAAAFAKAQAAPSKQPAAETTALLAPLPLERALPGVATKRTTRAHAVSLDELVVVVGYGEVGPWGSSRSRWAMERDGVLSLEAVCELAWLTGRVRPVSAADRSPADCDWIDLASGEPCSAFAVKARYEAALLATSGVRLVDTSHGYDPTAAVTYVEVRLERDFELSVDSRAEADAFVAGAPDATEVSELADGRFRVVRKRGATVRVPRAVKLDRFVAGQVPDGFDVTRYGVSPELAAQVDRITLYNLVATVEAFLSAGLEPEEIYDYLHPARVGSTQSLGLGGMQKLRRLYVDHLHGEERQSDAVQETLINVVTGYVVQAYLGSYGPMSFPVGACATAAVSVADAMSKLQANVADFVVTGGADDFGRESVVGFADMNATANNEELLRRGINPERMCRPNDRRRAGFLESHGAGALLLCRGSVAAKMGLPVYAVVGYASTYGDGIQQSVPAPGIGALAAAPALKQTLEKFALGADDIALVSKHDTSTTLNDLNENRLHSYLQRALGRSPGLPLFVVSQKALTGHPKGAAAAWQMIGVMQAMAESVVPPNRNLQDVDPAMREFSSLVFTDAPLRLAPGTLRAALVTSLGFGHISGVVLLLHPELFAGAMGDEAWADYAPRARRRLQHSERQLQRFVTGERAPFAQRKARRYRSEAEEVTALTQSEVLS